MNWYTIGCLSTALQVVIGAAGGHKEKWSQERKDIFQKATFYHFMNNVGMIVGSFITPQASLSPYLFLGGILLFALPLFHRAFTDSKELSGKLPPFGGMAMILGWSLLAFKR